MMTVDKLKISKLHPTRRRRDVEHNAKQEAA
jgi:hypothetical protein